MLSAIENRMSSLLMKSEMGISSTSWFKKVPGYEVVSEPDFYRLKRHTLQVRSHSLRSSAFFLLKARSISSRSPSCVCANGMTCFSVWLK